jgi:hypothetical protein
MRAVSFLLIMILLLEGTSWIFYPRDNTAAAGNLYPDTIGYYNIPNNTIDALVLGNSNAYCGYSPMYVWGEFGISSYVIGEPKQQIGSMIPLLLDFYKKQSPKYVFLEVDEVLNADNTVANVLYNQMVEVFPVLKYHNKWKDLDFSTLMNEQSTYSSATYGQTASTVVKAYTGSADYMSAADSSCPSSIPYTALYFLNLTRSICESHGSELILINFPVTYFWSNAKHNLIRSYADKSGLKYIDMNLMNSGLHIDWETDSFDGGFHLNTSGSKKASVFLGSFLKSFYSVVDHRSDTSYKNWKVDFINYIDKYSPSVT